MIATTIWQAFFAPALAAVAALIIVKAVVDYLRMRKNFKDLENIK